MLIVDHNFTSVDPPGFEVVIFFIFSALNSNIFLDAGRAIGIRGSVGVQISHSVVTQRLWPKVAPTWI